MALSIVPLVVFGPAVLAAGNTILYTVPGGSGSGATITKMVVANLGASGVGLQLSVLRAGGTLGTSSIFYPSQQVLPNTDTIVNEVNGLVLGPGDSLIANPTAAASLNVLISGYSFST